MERPKKPLEIRMGVSIDGDHPEVMKYRRDVIQFEMFVENQVELLTEFNKFTSCKKCGFDRLTTKYAPARYQDNGTFADPLRRDFSTGQMEIAPRWADVQLMRRECPQCTAVTFQRPLDWRNR